MTDSLTRALHKANPARWVVENIKIKHISGRFEYYSFEGYEFLREIIQDQHPRQCTKKCTQIGLTVAGLAKCLHVNVVWGLDVLYILPTQDEVQDFSNGRAQVTIEESPTLRDLYQDVKNVHHKRAGQVNFYMRGPARVRSVPSAMLVLDEVDVIDPGKVAEAQERTTGQENFWELQYTTPTVPGTGIDLAFLESDQREFLMPCPHCGERTDFDLDRREELEGDDGLRVGIACRQCSKLFFSEDRAWMVRNGVWIPRNPGHEIHGRQINKLYSPSPAAEWSELVRKLRRAEQNPDSKVLAEFWRNYGRAFVEQGFQISTKALRQFSADDNHKSGPCDQQMICAGVDAGVRGHYLTILGKSLDLKHRIERHERVRSLADVATRIFEHGATSVVIDAQPNTESSRKLQLMLWDKGVSAWLCYYSDSMKGRVKWDSEHDDGPQVVVNRTEILNESLGRLSTGDIIIPLDAPSDVWEHVRNMRRSLETKGGNMVSRWVADGPDHFAHSINYAWLAQEVAGGEEEYDEQEVGTGGFEEELEHEWEIA